MSAWREMPAELRLVVAQGLDPISLCMLWMCCRDEQRELRRLYDAYRGVCILFDSSATGGPIIHSPTSPQWLIRCLVEGFMPRATCDASVKRMSTECDMTHAFVEFLIRGRRRTALALIREAIIYGSTRLAIHLVEATFGLTRFWAAPEDLKHLLRVATTWGRPNMVTYILHDLGIDSAHLIDTQHYINYPAERPTNESVLECIALIEMQRGGRKRPRAASSEHDEDEPAIKMRRLMPLPDDKDDDEESSLEEDDDDEPDMQSGTLLVL